MGPGEDTWGRDPAVRRLRGAFARMEAVQAELLGAAGVGPLEPRVRRWREAALARLEARWPREPGRDEGALYAECLAQVLAENGVFVPESVVGGEADR